MSKTDTITEMLVGERGAVWCIGKLYISPRRQEIDGMQLVMIGGAVVSPEGGNLVLPENAEYSEMWECEIIIIPKRKYSSFDKKGKGPEAKVGGRRFGGDIPFNGYRIDQVLCGNYGDPQAWGREYFEQAPEGG